MKKIIYLDHSAGTPLDPKVQKYMTQIQGQTWANPSALYTLGVSAKKILETSRAEIASLLNAHAREIIFTSTGTESNNLAIVGTCFGARQQGNHIITSLIEHPSVLRTCQAMEKEGFEVTYLQPDSVGIIQQASLQKALRRDTIFVSLMYANNEVGTIQDVSGFSSIIRKHRKQFAVSTPYFHTDACQASPYLLLDVMKHGVDLMTINSSKVYGPRGASLLYVRKNTPISEVVIGGGQERGLRSGTENVSAIAGLAMALSHARALSARESKRLGVLRDFSLALLQKEIPHARVNGDLHNRLPNNIHITLPGIDAEALVLFLDRQGFCVGRGSACSSGSIEPSHVLRAIGLSDDDALSSIRVTLGRATSKQDMIAFVRALRKVIVSLK